MNKFWYAAGEIEIADSQCELCIYRLEGNQTACEKFQEKPTEIVHNEEKCPYVRNKNFVDLKL